MAGNYDTVDAYIASFPDDVRPILEEVRSTVRAAVPGVEESISYDMATFGLQGRYLVYLAGWKKHVSLHAVPDLPPELETNVGPYRSGRGTVRFFLNQPVPLDLIDQMITQIVR